MEVCSVGSQDRGMTIARYLLSRLEQGGVRHLFGVPGDYVLDFLDETLRSPIRWIGNCNELNAGYAADGYARQNGLGAVVVTFGVGGLSLVNAVAGAFSERVPVVVISGAPHTARRRSNALVHHLTRDYGLQFDVFRKITCDAALLVDPSTAPDEIDRVLSSCLSKKGPVYLEIPMDMALARCRTPEPISFVKPPRSDPEALSECVEEATRLIDRSERPMVLAGVELLRFDLARSALAMIEKVELPFATTVSSKSVLPELHPQFVGLYQGGLSLDAVREQIEESDCVLALGVWLTDFDTGLFSAKLDDRRLILANTDRIRIKHHDYPDVRLADFLDGLANSLAPRSYLASHPAQPVAARGTFVADPDKPLTVRRFQSGLDAFLDDSMILMADTGDALCCASELHVEEPENFMVQAYYLSIGYTVPASLGVALAKPAKRPVLLVGDGAFQMTAQEVSTLLRYDCHPVIFVLNNQGYTIERLIHEDGLYNDLQNWKYHELPAVFGSGSIGLEVRTEGDLAKALEIARGESDRLVLVELRVGPLDCSDALARFADKIRKKTRDATTVGVRA